MAACSRRPRPRGQDVDAARVPDGLPHGDPRPRRREVDLLAAELHFQLADGPGGRAHHLLDHLHDQVVVDVRLVCLQHGELRVVLEADALVAEVLADLVDPVDAADDAALEIELDRDAQVEVAVELVVVRGERPRHGAAVQRLQDRRLDLDEAALVEEAADGADHVRALDEALLDLVVDDEVEVAAAVARLHVGEAVELLRQRTQRLGEQAEVVNLERELAAAGADHGALGAEDVAHVQRQQRA